MMTTTVNGSGWKYGLKLSVGQPFRTANDHHHRLYRIRSSTWVSRLRTGSEWKSKLSN